MNFFHIKLRIAQLPSASYATVILGSKNFVMFPEYLVATPQRKNIKLTTLSTFSKLVVKSENVATLTTGIVFMIIHQKANPCQHGTHRINGSYQHIQQRDSTDKDV